MQKSEKKLQKYMPFFFNNFFRHGHVNGKTGQKLFSIFPQTLLVLYLLEVSIVTLKSEENKQKTSNLI